MTDLHNPGKRAATASLTLGLIAAVLLFFIHFPIIFHLLSPSLYDFLFRAPFSNLLYLGIGVLGIVGVTRAVKAKRLGFAGDRRLAGFALSLLGLYYGFANMISQFFQFTFV